MKKNLCYIMFLIICIFSFSIVYAENLTIIEDAVGNLHNALDEVNAQIIYERFNLDYAYENGDYTLPDSFSFRIAKKYANNDDILANLEEDKANGIVSYGSNTKFAGRVLTYDNSIAKNGIVTPNGTIKLKFRNAVVFSDNTYGDLYLEVSNFKIENGYKDTTMPIGIMANDMTMISYFALQELTAEAAARDSDKVPSLTMGMNYDIYMYVKKGDELVDSKMALIFTDTDQPDRINNGYLDDSGELFPYVESVILKSGVIDNEVHVRSDNVLHIADSPSGINTRFAGTKLTGGEDEKLSGFAFLVSTKGFRYSWTAPVGGTHIGLLGTFNIETSTNIPNVSITPSVDRILWKTSKTITITPDEGYFVSKITIDDEVIDYQSLELTDGKRVYTKDDVSYTFYETNGEIKYTFNSIIEDHSLSVSVDQVRFIINTEAENGKIDPSIEIKKDDNIEIKYEPLDGYSINKLIIDDKEYTIKEINENQWNNSYTFNNVLKEHTIKVIFTQIENPKTGMNIAISLLIVSGLIIGSIYYIIKRRNYLSKI